MATFNNTFIHVTDLSGRETYCRITGGMKVKADREESSPYAAMLAAVDVCKVLEVVGINAIHIKLRGRGGVEDPQASRRKSRTVTTADNRHEAAAPQHFTYANATF